MKPAKVLICTIAQWDAYARQLGRPLRPQFITGRTSADIGHFLRGMRTIEGHPVVLADERTAPTIAAALVAAGVSVEDLTALPQPARSRTRQTSGWGTVETTIFSI